MKTLLGIMPFIFMMGMLNAQSVIHVPAEQSTIQAGVNAASNTDTVLVADGTYTGAGNNSITLDGKAIVVKSANGPANCIMDSEEDGYFGFADGIPYDGVKASVEGFTIRNCKGPGFYYYAGSGPDIIGNIIESCAGGIIMMMGGDQSVIKDNIIQNNTSSGIEVGDFSGTISSNIISNNTAGSSSGAGLHVYRSEAIVMNNLISDNAAKNSGGGIYAREDTSRYINNTLTNNNSVMGSGMYVKESSPILINNIIAHSELYLSPEDDKFAISSGTAHNITTTYSYSGGVVVGATISTGFINNGAACDVTVHVTGIDTDTVVAVGSYEQFNLVIACGVGGSSHVNTGISSDTDTLIISASSPEINLTPKGFSVTSRGTAELPGGGLIATESEDIVVKNNLFFGNAGGGFFEGNSEDGFVEVALDGSNGNVTTDPLLNESTKVPLAGSPCIDMGSSETEGIQLPETDVYGNERFVDGNSDGFFEIDVGASEYKYWNVVGIIESEAEEDNTLTIFPNPFTRLAHIQFSLPDATHVTLELYDYLGRRVASLLNGHMPSGRHSLDFDSEALSGGIYFFRLQSDELVLKRKVILHR
jgi:parallel beta helix pectate lyase-like protein/type IX secretion system substrate protein